MQDYCFVGGTDCTEIDSVLLGLVMDCTRCLGKRQHFCLEKSCCKALPFCLKCDGTVHVLHRINDLRMVFVDRKLVKCSQAQARSYLQELIDMLSKQKKRCDEAIKESMQMSSQLSSLLDMFRHRLRELTELNSLSQLYTLVEDAVKDSRDKYRGMFEQEEVPQPDERRANGRQEFERLFQRVDFTEEFRFEQHPLFSEVTSHLDRYLTEVMQAGVESCGYSFQAERQSQLSTYFRIRKNYFGQELFTFLKQTHLNAYLGESWNLVVPIVPSFLRSVMVQRFDPRYTIGRRLHITNSSTEQFQDNRGERGQARHQRKNGKDLQRLKNFVRYSRTLVELCAYTCELSQLPKSLKSLCCTWQKQNLHKLPANLKCLRLVVSRSDDRPFGRNPSRQPTPVRQHMRIRNNDDYILLNESSGFLDDSELQEIFDSYSLQHFTKLKYLVVIDPDIKPHELKKLLLLAITNQYRLLALLDRKSLQSRIYIEEGGSHIYPQLESHCKQYRRRMMQCLAMARTLHLSRSYFREEAMEACSPPQHCEGDSFG